MKIWIKILIGSVIGLIVGIFVPNAAQTAFTAISSFLLGVGRYVIFPLVFFSLGIGAAELRQERRLARVYLSAFKYLALATALLVVIGTISVLLFPPERLPIPITTDAVMKPVSVYEGLTAIFPRNLFTIFFRNGDFLFPIMVLAFLLGVNMEFDRQLTRPIMQLFDSLSRIFYHMNSFIVELFGLAMIVITAATTMQLLRTNLGMYTQILIILAADAILVVFGVFPACLYFLGVKSNPYRWLYASLGPALTGLFTGDHYVSLGVLTKHGRESLGVPRTIGSAVYPLFASIGRAGTAMISAVSFILILRSYSGLEITFLQVLIVIGLSFVVSFVLGSVPGTGVYFSLFMLCSLYGPPEGYLILKDVAPLLISLGVFIDVVSSAFTSLLIAREENLWTEVETENFI